MNIFLHELKTYRRSAVTWAVALSLITVMFLSIYPAFTKDIESSKQMLANFPPAVRDALGISLQTFFTIFGFYAYIFTFISLAGAVQAMNIGVGIISKEDSNKTTDFLLTKPITRSKILTSKILAALATLIITNVIFVSVALIGAKTVTSESFSSKTFLLISFTLLLIQLFFLALGNLLAVVVPKIKSVISISLPVVFAFFIISTVGAVIGEENVRYVTPFKFYNPLYIVNNGRYENKFLLIEAVFIIVAMVASFIIYLRKDTRAAS